MHSFVQLQNHIFFKKLVEFAKICENFQKFCEIRKFYQIFKPIFCENFEIAAVQKDANLVELEKCCQTHIFLQNFVLIQPRTSPLKTCKIWNFANFADPNPLTYFDAWFLLRLSGHSNLTVQASWLSSNSLQRSFFFFARMSCSEQSAFHGQAADPVWFFSELLFQSVAAKLLCREPSPYTAWWRLCWWCQM